MNCFSRSPSTLIRRSAFTLIEISIVIVVIGLVVGGILVGRDLIKAAELRAFVSEIEKLRLSITAFSGKYNGLPGDIIDATSYFSGVNNGDGNGLIAHYGSGGGSNYQEEWQVFRHLSAAGMIDGGPYSGVAGSNGMYHAVIGTNVMASKVYTRIGYMFMAGTDIVWNSNYQSTPLPDARWAGNTFVMGRTADPNGSSTTETVGGFLTPLEAFNIDKKIDDGKPGTGKMQVIYPGYHGYGTPWCVTGIETLGDPIDPDTSQYRIAVNTNLNCSLSYKY